MKLFSFSHSIHLLCIIILGSITTILQSCKDDNDPYEKPNVTITPIPENGTILFDKESGDKTITLKTNRKWKIEVTVDTDWVAVTPSSGNEGEHNIKISVLSNNGDAREAQMIITASSKRFVFNIQQKSINNKTFEYTNISEIVAMGNKLDNEQGTKTIDEDLRIKAIITTDYQAGQFPFSGYHHIQDANGGAMALIVPKGENPIPFGTEITAKLRGCQLTNYRGTIQVQIPHNQMKLVEGCVIEPQEVTIKDILSGKHANQFVRLNDVQFQKYKNEKFFDGKFSSKRHNIEDKNGNVLSLEIWKNAIFKDELLPEGSGYIIGIATYNVSKSGHKFNNLRPINRESIILRNSRFIPNKKTDSTEKLNIIPLNDDKVIFLQKKRQ